MTDPTRATVLFAHGSRDPRWSQAIEAVAAHMRMVQPGASVACAYLEHAQPDLDQAVGTLVRQGAQVVVIVPMFLGVGQHVRNDLPELLRAQQQRHPDVRIELRPAIGEDARVIGLLAEVAAG